MSLPAGRCNGFLAVTAGLLLALAAAPAHALALSDAEKRGKQIYLRGTSADGSEVNALVGREGVALPASAVPCASCHGPDGRGRPEGGIIPPDIRWSELTKVYGHVHEEGRRQGRRHPAFDEESLARLIRTGVDPGDNRLDQAMPMYQMPEGGHGGPDRLSETPGDGSRPGPERRPDPGRHPAAPGRQPRQARPGHGPGDARPFPSR